MMLRILRLVYGVLLVSVLFLPFGIYHTMVEPYASGALWGFMLPIGYVAAASGVAVILYPRSRILKRIGFGYLLVLTSSLMLLSVFLFPRELSIELLHGTTMIDLDYSIFTGAITWLSLLSMVAGLFVRAKEFNHHLNRA